MKAAVNAVNAGRIERHYHATLTDAALAAAWVTRYLHGLEVRAGARVLDYGCGRGRVSGLLQQQGLRVVALDITAHAWWRRLPRVAFVLTSPEPVHVPFRDGTFDVVLNIDSTHYYASGQLRRHIEEVHRILAPGGAWIVLQVNGEGYGASPAQVRPPGRLHRMTDVRRLSLDAGFTEMDSWYEGVALPAISLLHARVRHLLRPWPLYMYDYDSWVERLVPARHRHRWVLRMRKETGR